MSTARITKLLSSALLGLGLVALPGTAEAQVEVEVDPFAYALNGFSLHVAKVLGPTRLNVGTFGIDVPRFFHGNEGWNARMRGAGLKWDYLGGSLDGYFAGVEGGYMRMTYELEAEGESVKRDVFGGGVRAGYRRSLGSRGLYVSPWAGVGYNLGGSAVRIGSEEFDRRRIDAFATVHVGWRFGASRR